MNLTDAALKARALMNHHGLGHVPFEFDRGRRRIGCTHYRYDGNLEKITLSKHYAELLEEDEIVDTILHEIAHALSPFNEGHGRIWQQNARMIGADPVRCKAPSARPEGAWKSYCPNCETVSTNTYHRAPLRVKSCGQCSPGKWRKHCILKWFKNGTRVPTSQMPVRFQQEMARIQSD